MFFHDKDIEKAAFFSNCTKLDFRIQKQMNVNAPLNSKVI